MNTFESVVCKMKSEWQEGNERIKNDLRRNGGGAAGRRKTNIQILELRRRLLRVLPKDR